MKATVLKKLYPRNHIQTALPALEPDLDGKILNLKPEPDAVLDKTLGALRSGKCVLNVRGI